MAPSPSLAQSLPRDARQEDVWKMAAATWSRPIHPEHLAVNRPTCTVTGCREGACTWSRCRRKPCRAIVARCPTHNPTDPMLRARDAHEDSHR